MSNTHAHVHTQTNGYLGIMICEKPADHAQTLPFTEISFYRRLSLEGTKLGLRVFVFSPCRIEWALDKVWGYLYSPKTRSWNKLLFPLPDLIYNRCFYRGRQQYMDHRPNIHKLIEHTDIRFLGSGLRGKWEVQQALWKEPAFRPHLPPTDLYRGPKTILPWFKTKRQVFLKPQGGSQGRGILHVIWKDRGHYVIKGRDPNNQMLQLHFTQSLTLFQWITRFIGRKKYIIQPYLTLTNYLDEAYDIRSLVQKNGSGLWQITGIAVRRGQRGSITSNLHGGGTAEEVRPFLEAEFGGMRSDELIARIQQLSLQIPPILEEHHGRLFELGIDFGIDHEGRIWILEVNSKPGRAVFAQLKDKPAIFKSIFHPVSYARYILDKPPGG